MSERDPLVGSKRPTETENVLQILTEKTAQFNSEVSQLQRLTDQLGTSRDSERLRQQLRTKREDCANLAKSTMQLVKRAKIDRSEKVKFDKVMGQFNDIFNRCQILSKQSIQQERITTIPNAASIPEQNPTSISSRSGPKEGETQKILVQLESESYNVDYAIIQERNEDIKFLESELRGLNEMFVDISQMISDQGVAITTIETNVSTTNARVEDGVKELKKASEYQKSNRTLLCIILLIFVIVMAVVGGGVALYFTVFKK